ncbi:MAG: glycosyltransferase family 4 protein [Myxococcota bacterium]
MRILHLTRDYPPRINGGLSTAVGSLVTALDRFPDLEHRVLSFDAWRPKARGSTAVPMGGARGVHRLRSPDALEGAVRWGTSFAPHLVHVHDPRLWEVATDLSPVRVLTMHVAHGAAALRRGIETQGARAEREAVAEAHVVTVGHPAMRADVPPTTARLEVAPLAVDDHALAREAAASPRPQAVALVVGRFAEVKGLYAIVAAWRHLRERGVKLELHLAGGLVDSPKADRRWRRKLTEAAGRHGEELTFLGWLDPEALSRAYGRSSMLVAASVYETFGLACLEAMLHGLPVIVGRASGLRSLVRPDVTGLLTDGNPAELAAAMAYLAADGPVRVRMGRQAAQDARARWLWGRGHAAKWRELYRELAHSHVG